MPLLAHWYTPPSLPKVPWLSRCTVSDMTPKVGAEPPNHSTGATLQVLRLEMLATGHHTHRSSTSAALRNALARLPHLDSTCRKGWNPVMAEAHALFANVMPIRLGECLVVKEGGGGVDEQILGACPCQAERLKGSIYPSPPAPLVNASCFRLSLHPGLCKSARGGATATSSTHRSPPVPSVPSVCNKVDWGRRDLSEDLVNAMTNAEAGPQ